MEKKPEVSVIVPVYQVESYLERAVESLLAQTLEELEIILVDDGSTDQSPRICDGYGERYPQKVRVLHQENQGLGLARNAGLDLARGEYVAFVDSDDTVEPDMYRAMAEKARAGGYDMVFCDVRILYVDEGRESVSQTYPEENIDLGDYLVRGNNITYSVNKLYPPQPVGGPAVREDALRGHRPHPCPCDPHGPHRLCAGAFLQLLPAYTYIYCPPPRWGHGGRGDGLPAVSHPVRGAVPGGGGVLRGKAALLEHDPVPHRVFAGLYRPAPGLPQGFRPEPLPGQGPPGGEDPGLPGPAGDPPAAGVRPLRAAPPGGVAAGGGAGFPPGGGGGAHRGGPAGGPAPRRWPWP